MTDSAMEAEFDVVAGWTEEAVRELGPDHAVPAGCRGSGSPSSLAWLADRLELAAGDRLLDSGAGVGGPAAWLAERRGVRPVCAEPMAEAAGAARRLFGLPSVLAWSQALPFVEGAFDAAWCLGVLCTVEDKAGVLAELRRVLRPGGRLGLLVLVADGPLTVAAPEGNAFPSRSELAALLEGAGFTLLDSVDAAGLAATPPDWQARADRVEDLMADRHGTEPAWQQAQTQSARMGSLLDGGGLASVLLVAR